MLQRILCAGLVSLVAGVPLSAGPSDPECSGPIVYAGVQLEKLCLDVPYGPHPCQRIDVYLVDSDEPAPVLVELHGGAFWGGAKSQFGSYLDGGGGNGVIELALRHGISVVSIGYRLSAITDGDCRPILAGGAPQQEPAHAFPVPHEDALAALEFVRARARSGEWNLDPTRIAAIGASAGGSLALGLGLREASVLPTAGIGSRGPTARELRAVFSLLAPTDFTPASFDLCPGGDPGAWHFGASDLTSFRSEPSVLARRAAASPRAWVAAAARASATRVQGVYLGTRGWTVADLHHGGVPCTGQGDPLALPTSNAHAAAFGLLLEQELQQAGFPAEPTLFIDPYACASIAIASATEVADLVAASLDRSPGYPLGQGGTASPTTGRVPRLSAFGRFEPHSRVTLWMREGVPGSSARLLLAPRLVPARNGGWLLAGGTGVVALDLPPVDGCGFLSVQLDPALLAGGPLVAQVELSEGGPAGKRVLTDAWRLE